MSLSKNVHCGVGVAHVMRPADRTVPLAHGKRKLFIAAHDMPAYAACLRGVLRRYKNDLAFIHFAFLLQKRQKRSPSGVADRLCKAVILQQTAHLKILRRNQIVAFDQLLGDIVKVVSSLSGNFSLEIRNLLTLLLIVAAVTKFAFVLLRPLSPPAQLLLGLGKLAFEALSELRVLKGTAVRVINQLDSS